MNVDLASPQSLPEACVSRDSPPISMIWGTEENTQLCILQDQFQKQKYLSLQQMQELAIVLNLSYRQVKTWLQNQRMKCKRWQKNTKWPNSSNGVAQKGCLPSGNLPVWSNQSWNNQSWNNQAWNNQFQNCREEFMLPQIQFQFQQNSASDLEASQTMELLLNDSMNIQPEDEALT
ncbi:PREDICTED: homeobox protein NANOG-like [Chrysochloris asiatica]|uniref:Homeobox protein NANOG-like n=1 Tax=Chrysochloris asiatica TaxID=185453 RepID=A0A9B0UEF8_CHRAS|nr:PREDICTED: homeobox protein NANOG-like [Chrysochloris asiatica]